jgi:DNA polymerase V
MNSTGPVRDEVIRVGRDGADSPTGTRARVVTGFGSPADDTGVTRLDLNDILVRHPLATFMMRASGGAMHEAGIHDGDLVLVDRASTPSNGHVVIAVVDGEFICRSLAVQGHAIRLQAADANTADIVLDDGDTVQIWGVVTHAIKAMPT